MRSDLVTERSDTNPASRRTERPQATPTAACAPAARGYVQVYTGEGKGKTTAAFGLALRAAGHGKRVYIGQFMKGQPSGEVAALDHHPQITVEQFGSPGCIGRDEVIPGHRSDASGGLARASAALTSGDYDLVVLDELDVAVWFDLLSERDCAELIEARPALVELVITGRSAPRTVLERADLVTEMREVKHYYRRGVAARAGIEF
jgi:cob(I)alamin adenosyltransferase